MQNLRKSLSIFEFLQVLDLQNDSTIFFNLTKILCIVAVS